MASPVPTSEKSHYAQKQQDIPIAGLSEDEVHEGSTQQRMGHEAVQPTVGVEQSSRSSRLLRNNQKWDSLKEEIRRLYVLEGENLATTMGVIEKTHGFNASSRKWKSKLEEWGFNKHIAARDMQFVVAKAEQRAREQQKDTVFYHNGQVINHERLENFKRRKTMQSGEPASPSAATPPNISYGTPPNIAYDTPQQVSSDDRLREWGSGFHAEATAATTDSMSTSVGIQRGIHSNEEDEFTAYNSGTYTEAIDFNIDSVSMSTSVESDRDKYANKKELTTYNSGRHAEITSPITDSAPAPVGNDKSINSNEEQQRTAYNSRAYADVARPTTDLGYASVERNKGISNEEDDDACTIMTENCPLDIEGSVRESLTKAIADELCHSLEVLLQGKGQLNPPAKDVVLPLLKDFAVKLRYMARHGVEQDASLFVRQQRGRIAASFERRLLSYVNEEVHDTAPSPRGGGMHYTAKVEQWDISAADPPEETPGDFDDTADEEPQFSSTRPFIFESKAYRDLVERLSANILLTERVGVIVNIRHDILDNLETYPKDHGYKLSTSIAGFDMLWTPLDFVKQQFPNTSTPRLGDILVYTGMEIDAHGSTCEQYIQQSWGAVGMEVLRGLEEVLCKERIGQLFEFSLPENSWLQITLNVTNILVSASAPDPALADIGEILAWLVGAIREAPRQHEMSYSTPRITSKLSSRPSFVLDTVFTNLRLDRNSWGGQPNGTCWHKFVRNPVIVKGFPIPRRQNGEKGLEIRLELLSALGNASRITTFGQGLIIKGHSTMFVPIKRTNKSTIWHFLFNKDETRISYLDADKHCSDRLSLEDLCYSDLETTRTFVGWSSSVHLQTGATSNTIAYDNIEWTGSNFASAGCAFEKVSITAGKIINAGFTFARGVKDTPLYLSRAMAYEQEIHQAGNFYVVLYDMRDRRGWLVDGASALLHLTCTQLVTVWSHKSPLLKLEEFNYADPGRGASAAAAALLDPRNRELPILEESETWKEVTITTDFTNSEPFHKEEQKTKTKQWCYQDLVRQTYHILELMHDYQVHALTSPGMALRFTDRDKLEGFAFMDIVDGPNALRPRVATLKPSGKGWVDFVRSISAITLLGKGFGELITVADGSNAVCRHWQLPPTGQDYLIACISTLSEICKRQGDRDACPMELASGIFWHKAHMLFEPCNCKEGRISKCDRVQVLLPPSLGRKQHPRPFNKVNGAVIFGRSKRYQWTWPNTGNPTERVTISEDEGDSEVAAQDSALSTSLDSRFSIISESSVQNHSTTRTSNTSPLALGDSPGVTPGAPRPGAEELTSGSDARPTTSILDEEISFTPLQTSLSLDNQPKAYGLAQKLDLRFQSDIPITGPPESNEQSSGLKRRIEQVKDLVLPSPKFGKRIKRDKDA